MTYDLGYDLIVSQGKKQEFVDYIALQGAKCAAAGPSYGPGNINMLWTVCDYGSAMLIDGEDAIKNIVDEPVLKLTPSAQQIAPVINASGIRISNTAGSGTTDYIEGIDYFYRYVPSCGAKCIDWSPAGVGTKEPAYFQTYYVSYTFTPDVAGWKTEGRQAIEYHLNYNWRDGFYQGGLCPYGCLVAEMLPTLITMLKRDTGVDYTQNPDVKHLVDMYLYSLLPSPGTTPGVDKRFNTINDAHFWDAVRADVLIYPSQFDGYSYKAWLRPFIAWATTVYANDPEYSQKYVWLWAYAYRDGSGNITYNQVADWREALWMNDTTLAPYVNHNATPPAPWSNQRYFRGREVLVSKTNDWNQPNVLGSYFSVVAGNHNYQNEHDQGDDGSFTFFSLNEDWGLDPGYDASDLVDHNTVGIDGAGLNATGVSGAVPKWGGSTSFHDVAMSNTATVVDMDLKKAWSVK
jgi:hypothetical protein